MEMMDALGLPEFFYTDIGRTEPAGGNCVRVYCCIQRDGVLVPQFTVVMPATALVTAARRATEAAIQVLNGCAVMSAAAH